MVKRKPAIFVGSSTEGQKIGKAVQVLLDDSCEATVWSQGVFGLSLGPLESLVLQLNDFDFAILILTPDDLVTKRGVEAQTARDNVLFELGLFMGGLGRDRTFVVYDRTERLQLPSDLAGVTAATFEMHSSGKLESSLGAAVTKIEAAIERLGVRNQKRGISNVFSQRTKMPLLGQILDTVQDGSEVAIQGVSLSQLLPFHINLIVEKAMLHKVRFKMLLMRPDAEIADVFGKETGENEAFKAQLRAQSMFIDNLLEKLQDCSHAVEVRVYDTIPFNFILRYTDKEGTEVLYLAIYMNGRPGAECPVIKLTRDDAGKNEFFDEVTRSFDDFWKRAVPRNKSGAQIIAPAK